MTIINLRFQIKDSFFFFGWIKMTLVSTSVYGAYFWGEEEAENWLPCEVILCANHPQVCHFEWSV